MRVLALLFSGVVTTPAVQAPRPRLVVVITVDQLRPDYLDRYRRQLTDGLGLLVRDGAVFTNAFQDHAVTETAPGHATVLSGRWPAHTGIMRNAAGVEDSSAPLLGVDGPPASPSRFSGSALFDWLEAAVPGARALSVSRKDRGAILPLGRAKQEAYWYRSGTFTTSRYYADSLPGWVRAFNARRIPFQSAGAVWTPLLPLEEYPEPDSVPSENLGRDFVFPHHLPVDGAEAAEALADVPTMDSLTLAFALEGVRALALGARGSTDLLAVSLSTTDAIGHRYGPESREIHDQIVRLDRYLGWFLGQLFVRYGPSSVLVVLTADHGVTPNPEWSRAHGHVDAQAVDVDSIVQDVNAKLPRRPDGKAWLIFDEGMLLVTEQDKLSAAGGLSADSVLADIGDRIGRVAGVARVQRPAELPHADSAGDLIARRWLHALAPDGGVALVVTLRPWSVWGSGRTAGTHGQPSDLDAHVPLIFWGREIQRGIYPGRVSAVDVAPTLARLLDLTPTEPLDGHVLTSAIAHPEARQP